MRFEEVMAGLPREKVACLPTPITRLTNEEAFLHSAYAMYLKRDDLTGIGAGGNKVRCMEYILGLPRPKAAIQSSCRAGPRATPAPWRPPVPPMRA